MQKRILQSRDERQPEANARTREKESGANPAACRVHVRGRGRGHVRDPTHLGLVQKAVSVASHITSGHHAGRHVDNLQQNRASHPRHIHDLQKDPLRDRRKSTLRLLRRRGKLRHLIEVPALLFVLLSAVPSIDLRPALSKTLRLMQEKGVWTFRSLAPGANSKLTTHHDFNSPSETTWVQPGDKLSASGSPILTPRRISPQPSATLVQGSAQLNIVNANEQKQQQPGVPK